MLISPPDKVFVGALQHREGDLLDIAGRMNIYEHCLSTRRILQGRGDDQNAESRL